MTRRALLVALLALGSALPVRADWRGSGEVPIGGDGNVLLVQARVNGRASGTFLLDSGASICAVSADIARRAGARPSGDTVVLQTANGKVRAPLLRLHDLSVGGVRVSDVTAVVHDDLPNDLDGIVGLSFLNHFNYSVDARNRILRLR